MEVRSISNFECKDWLLNKHYAKRMCSISYAFGLFIDGILNGVCTFGKPPSPPLCTGICGDVNSEYVFELNRLCVNDNLPKNTLSFFVAKCLKTLPKMIIVSYADSSMSHNGYIYQATNWHYTGLSAIRTEWRMKNSNTHSKSLCDKYTNEFMHESSDFVQIPRPRKHRYVYFNGSKTQNKHWLKSLNYKIEPYPKGENKRYDSSYEIKTQYNMF